MQNGPCASTIYQYSNTRYIVLATIHYCFYWGQRHRRCMVVPWWWWWWVGGWWWSALVRCHWGIIPERENTSIVLVPRFNNSRFLMCKIADWVVLLFLRGDLCTAHRSHSMTNILVWEYRNYPTRSHKLQRPGVFGGDAGTMCIF